MRRKDLQMFIFIFGSYIILFQNDAIMVFKKNSKAA